MSRMEERFLADHLEDPPAKDDLCLKRGEFMAEEWFIERPARSFLSRNW